jgi:hypothetical protein
MAGVTRTGQRSYDYQATGGQEGHSVTHQMAKPAPHLVAYDRATHRLAHDETRTRRGSALPRRVRVRGTATKVDDEKRASGPTSSAYRGREVLAPPQPMLGRQHVMTCTRSGGQSGATLAAAGRQDGAAGTGAHTQPEAVGLRATTVVRLEGALAHSGAPVMIRWVAGCRLAVTVRPRVARITPECTASRSPTYALVGARVRDLCPSEAGGSSHRQLDLVTVRGAAASGQTSDPGETLVHRLGTTT